MKPTQIRVTNVSKNEVKIDFKDIINGKDLSDKGIRYEFEGEGKEENKLLKAYHMRINSVDVLKSIRKMIYPKVNLNELIKRNDTAEIKIDIKAEEIKLIMSPQYHMILTLFYK